jgi:hypothetical protein
MATINASANPPALEAPNANPLSHNGMRRAADFVYAY